MIEIHHPTLDDAEALLEFELDNRPYFNKASLGYRIGERFASGGYATKAVELVLSKARDDFDLWRIEATVRPENQASSRVLIRNGFTVYGTARRSMKLHGIWHDLMHFECHLQPSVRDAAHSVAELGTSSPSSDNSFSEI
ncbi:GNAT family protein [Paraburkholderia agricolaris]|uniref:GNAT family protein n=1 Tax=Paraburkholderia agricolaris TaxID=2152888 RepID=A0ABW8ZTK4_9BURK